MRMQEPIWTFGAILHSVVSRHRPQVLILSLIDFNCSQYYIALFIVKEPHSLLFDIVHH